MTAHVALLTDKRTGAVVAVPFANLDEVRAWENAHQHAEVVQVVPVVTRADALAGQR